MKNHLSEEEIAAYLEGFVSKDEKLEFEIHLANCEQCFSGVVESFSIQNETHCIPERFIHNATKRLTQKQGYRYLLYFESAALFLLVIFFGYNLIFRSAVSRFRINQGSVSQEKIAAVENENKKSFTDRPMDFARATKKSEQKMDKRERSPTFLKKRKDIEKGALNGSRNEDLNANLQPVPGKNDQEFVKSEGNARQALPSSTPPFNDRINAGVSNISETKNVAVPPKGPEMTKQNFQASSQMLKESDQQKRFLFEGDSTEESILNIQFLQEVLTKLSILDKDVKLLIEVNSAGKVDNVQSEADVVSNTEKYLISKMNKLLFVPSTISIRKIKITFFKKKIHKNKF